MREREYPVTGRAVEQVMAPYPQRERSELRGLMQTTPARIGIGGCGSRYRTDSYLRFLADHAAANDAVFQEVPEAVIQDLHVFEVQTLCRDKQEMLTRPDLGRLFSEETKQMLLNRCQQHVDVQIYFGDGLCAPSVKANAANLFLTIQAELESRGYRVGTPFFVRYCRVNTARTIGPLLDARVTCVLIGERPGLLTAESMSAYFAYHARPEMMESEYTVISNISRHGIPPVEAAAHTAELITQILRLECSGVEFSRKKSMLN